MQEKGRAREEVDRTSQITAFWKGALVKVPWLAKEMHF